MITDTHTHIYSEEFDADQREMLQRAFDSGVGRMIMPALGSERYTELYKLYQEYPNQIYPTIGLHPTYVKENYQEELSFVRQHLHDQGIVAIGEIGLDYYWSTEFREQQIEAFELQIDWAIEQDLPIIIHTRSSFDDLFAILRGKQHPKLRGVFHSFTGDERELGEALSFDQFYIGINGVVTFKNSNLRDYIGQIPIERLLIETDAPYLSPVPKRGKRNEPAFIIHTAEHIAPLYHMSMNQLAEATSANATRLFGL